MLATPAPVDGVYAMLQAPDSPAADAQDGPADARVFVVLNPMAGSSVADDVRAALERSFGDTNVDIYETTGDEGENIGELVRAAADRGARLVVAAGGDGTVSDVAEGLIGSDVPLGIIPVGTANVFARELELPLTLDDACALIAGDHATSPVDAMKVGEKYFVLQIGIGIDSLMIRDTDRQAKRRFGRAAYIWTMLTRLFGYQPLRFTIVADGKRLRPRASQVLVANGGVLGVPPFRWGPHITPNDGRIDVCIVSARTLLDYVGLIWHTVLGQQRRDRNVRYLAATSSISISADQPLPVQADGEIVGDTPLQIQVVPHAVQVIVPAPAGETLSSAVAAKAKAVIFMIDPFASENAPSSSPFQRGLGVCVRDLAANQRRTASPGMIVCGKLKGLLGRKRSMECKAFGNRSEWLCWRRAYAPARPSRTRQVATPPTDRRWRSASAPTATSSATRRRQRPLRRTCRVSSRLPTCPSSRPSALPGASSCRIRRCRRSR